MLQIYGDGMAHEWIEAREQREEQERGRDQEADARDDINSRRF